MVTYNVYMDHKFTYWLQYSNRKVAVLRTGGVGCMKLCHLDLELSGYNKKVTASPACRVTTILYTQIPLYYHNRVSLACHDYSNLYYADTILLS